MTMCRQWTLKTGSFFQPLCKMELWPETDNASSGCSICIYPSTRPPTSRCGCTSPVLDIPHNYRIVVEETGLGKYPPLEDHYGTWTLNTGNGCGAGIVLFPTPNEFTVGGMNWGQWIIRYPTFTVTTTAGKRYRNVSVEALQYVSYPAFGDPADGTWTWFNPTPIPACDNMDTFVMTLDRNNASWESNPALNPYYPNVAKDYFKIRLYGL